MLHYRLALAAASGASFAAIHFHGCNGKNNDDQTTAPATTAPASTPAPSPSGPTPAPSPPGPSPPGPSPPGPSPPGPNPDPFDKNKWSCKERGPFACGALSDDECVETSGGACWVDKLGQQNNRHGRQNGCTVRYCWHHTDEESCLGTRDCAWDPNYVAPVNHKAPNFRQQGSACYSCSMQGQHQVDKLPGACPDHNTDKTILPSEYKTLIGQVWRQCGMDDDQEHKLGSMTINGKSVEGSRIDGLTIKPGQTATIRGSSNGKTKTISNLVNEGTLNIGGD